MHLYNYLPDKTLSSLTNLLPEQLNLEGQWEVAVSELFCPSMCQIITEGKFMFLDNKLSNFSKFYHLESGLHLSFTDNVEATRTLIQESHNHSESCITVKVFQRTEKIDTYFANEGSGLAFLSTDLRHVFGSFVGIEFRVMLRREGPNKPEIVYNPDRIHPLMIYTDLTEDKIVGGKKTTLLPCLRFVSKVKAGDIKTTEHFQELTDI